MPTGDTWHDGSQLKTNIKQKPAKSANVTSKAFIRVFFILLAKNQRLKNVQLEFSKFVYGQIGTEKWTRVTTVLARYPGTFGCL